MENGAPGPVPVPEQGGMPSPEAAEVSPLEVEDETVSEKKSLTPLADLVQEPTIYGGDTLPDAQREIEQWVNDPTRD